MKKLARAVSFLLGPSFVLFPIPYVLVSKLTNDHMYAFKWAIFSYGFIVVTAVFVTIGVLLGIFSNFDVSKKEQRPLLFSLLAFSMFCYFISLVFLSAPKILFFGILFLVIGLVTVVIITKWIKASIHMAVLTSVIILISIAYKGYSFPLYLLIPLLAWARIKTKEHTFTETAIGTILGLVLTLSIYFISKQFLFGVIFN